MDEWFSFSHAAIQSFQIILFWFISLGIRSNKKAGITSRFFIIWNLIFVLWCFIN